jgi:hypothetical protein
MGSLNFSVHPEQPSSLSRRRVEGAGGGISTRLLDFARSLLDMNG